MMLCGKVASGMLLVFAAVFAVVAILVPDARREAIVAVVLTVTVGLFGVPALVPFFSPHLDKNRGKS